MNATATLYISILSNASTFAEASALTAAARTSEVPVATLATALSASLLDAALAMPGAARRKAGMALVASADLRAVASLLLSL